MRRPKYDINRIRSAFQDRGHGVDHDLDALAGRQQPECQNDGADAESQSCLCRVRRDKWKVGDTMGNDLDLLVRHAMDTVQQLTGLFGHHDDLRGRPDDSVRYRALDRARAGQHRVQCRDHRHGQARQQFEDVGTGVAAENPEFVLQADDVKSTSVQRSRGARILLNVVVPDLQSNRRRIVIGLVVVGHRHDAGLQVWS